MARDLAAAAAFLADKVAQNGVTVTFKRGASEVSLSATLGSTDHAADPGDGGAIHEFKSVDFICKAADYTVSGSAVEPARGDLIVYDGDEYAAAPGSDRDKVFRTLDPFGKTLRIHTTLRGAAS